MQMRHPQLRFTVDITITFESFRNLASDAGFDRLQSV
jgi:hypothetical protein